MQITSHRKLMAELVAPTPVTPPKHELTDEEAPLELKVPNAETRAAMEESRAMMATRRARFSSADELFADLEKNSSQ